MIALFRNLKKPEGFSILQALLASTLLSGLIFVILTQVQVGFDSQKSLDYLYDFESQIQEIRNHLKDPSFCECALLRGLYGAPPKAFQMSQLASDLNRTNIASLSSYHFDAAAAPSCTLNRTIIGPDGVKIKSISLESFRRISDDLFTASLTIEALSREQGGLTRKKQLNIFFNTRLVASPNNYELVSCKPILWYSDGS